LKEQSSNISSRAPNEPPTHAYSFGVEEEYFIVNRRTKALDDRQHKSLLNACKQQLGASVQTEMLQSQIEIVTSVLTDLPAARAELTRARDVVSTVAADHGLGIAAAGTYPLAAWREQRLTDKTRYHLMQDDLQIVGRRNVLCGLHIHVQPPVNASRTDLMNRVMPYMPVLLALSTSSPFWQTQRTGMKGYRLAAYDELPRTGLPAVFRNDGEYQMYIDALVTSGAIPDASQVWWAIRPSARFPTLELRIADSCTYMDDALCITALFRCLIRRLSIDTSLNAQMNPMWRLLVDENRWRAQRFGIDGAFLDIQRSTLRPFPEMIDDLLALIAEDAVALECGTETQHARTIVRRGTSADTQLRIYTEARTAGATRKQALANVADWLVETTATGHKAA
jgi:carboxylate-amine ligase